MDVRQRIRFTIVLAIVFASLFGCGVDLDTTATTTNPPTETTATSSQTETVTEPSPLMSEGPDYAITDLAIGYMFASPVMKTYLNASDPKTAYVDIEECMALFGKGVMVIPKRNEAKLDLNLQESIPEELRYEYGTPVFQFIMTFDATSDTVTINDTRMFEFMLKGKVERYDTKLRLRSSTITTVDRSMRIDLFKYEIDIVFEDNAFYIPLYLANLLLTGPSLEWFEMGETIVAYDSYTELDSLRNTYRTDQLMDLTTAGKNTEKYLGVYFDHFYGLKQSRSISSYRNMIKSYHLDEQPDYESYYRTLEQLMNAFDDLHTQLVSTGYNGMDFTLSDEFPETTRRAVLEEAFANNACEARTEEFTSRFSQGVRILEINAFSLQTKDFLSKAHLQRSQPIIIDVSCNTGGNLVGVVELLTYMTNNPIEIRTINPYTGERRVDTYFAEINRAIATPFYVLTSPVTYSAANLFVSIVQDMNLATVIGEPTMGGACAIQFTTLPDGSMIVSSSHFALVDAADRMIEDGVEVDIERRMPIDGLADPNRSFTLFEILTDSSLSVSQSGSSIRIDHKATYQSPSLTGFQYRLTIKEGTTIVHTQSYASTLLLEWPMLRHDTEYTVQVVVEFMCQNTFYHVNLFDGVFDDYGDHTTMALAELSLNQPLEGGRSSPTDRDAFWVVVTQPGTYQIRFGDGTTPVVTLYDYRRIAIETGTAFDLVAGRYIVSIGYPADGVFQIEWVRVVRPLHESPVVVPTIPLIHSPVDKKSQNKHI